MSENPADEIVPGLWLGSRVAALDPLWIGEHNIKCVFNCTKDHPYVETVQRRYRVPVDDNLEFEEIRNLEHWSFEVVYKMIREYQTGEQILVHCAAGRQRSAACVALFLIATRNMNPKQAMDYIKSKRPIAFYPSPNFLKAIEGFYTSYQKFITPKL